MFTTALELEELRDVLTSHSPEQVARIPELALALLEELQETRRELALKPQQVLTEATRFVDATPAVTWTGKGGVKERLQEFRATLEQVEEAHLA